MQPASSSLNGTYDSVFFAREAVRIIEQHGDEATRRLEMEANAMNRARLAVATQKRRERQDNLDWQLIKKHQLDHRGIVLLDKEEPHELSQQERQWNWEFQQMELAKAAGC